MKYLLNVLLSISISSISYVTYKWSCINNLIANQFNWFYSDKSNGVNLNVNEALKDVIGYSNVHESIKEITLKNGILENEISALKIKAIADKIILINVSNQGMNKWVWLTLGCLGLYSLIITLKFINLRKNFKISNEIANKSLDILAITGEELYSTIKAAEKINNINKELNINIKKSIKDMKDIDMGNYRVKFLPKLKSMSLTIISNCLARASELNNRYIEGLLEKTAKQLVNNSKEMMKKIIYEDKKQKKSHLIYAAAFTLLSSALITHGLNELYVEDFLTNLEDEFMYSLDMGSDPYYTIKSSDKVQNIFKTIQNDIDMSNIVKKVITKRDKSLEKLYDFDKIDFEQLEE